MNIVDICFETILLQIALSAKNTYVTKKHQHRKKKKKELQRQEKRSKNYLTRRTWKNHDLKDCK